MKKLQRTITILATAVVPVATPDGIRLLGASLGYSNHTRKAYFYLNLGYVF